jgi:hypothetical protein
MGKQDALVAVRLLAKDRDVILPGAWLAIPDGPDASPFIAVADQNRFFLHLAVAPGLVFVPGG